MCELLMGKGVIRFGRVGCKVEPAGKVRLFMIMDSLSQRLLHPLHQWVYRLLRKLPTDGTLLILVLFSG